MTSETGNRRHPTGKRLTLTPDTPPPGSVAQFTSYRTLDPVRAAALTAAIQSYHWTAKPMVDPTPELLDLARTFERYLTGEEAD